MNHTLRFLLDEARLSLRDPRAGAARVLRWQISDNALLQLVVLTAVLSTLAAEANSALHPPAPGQAAIYIPPLVLALMLAGVNLVMATALSVTGRLFGGEGGFRAALVLMTWQQALWLLLLIGLTVIGLVLPAISGFLTIGAFAFMIWVLTNFTAQLHGFSSLGLAVVVLVIGSVVASVVLMIFLGMLGLTIVGGPA